MRFLTLRLVVLPLVAGALLALPGAVAEAAFPGTNALIAFERGTDIYTVTASGSSPSQLVALASEPAWSPDGSKLAYVQSGSVIVRTVSGGATVTLDTGSSPAFSPDGTMITYEKSGDIHVVASGGPGPGRNLSNTGALTEDDPAWSPDGDRIAFTRTGANADIYEMDAPTDPATGGGGNEEQLTTLAANEARPNYLPSGGRVAYDSDQLGLRQIYTIPTSPGNTGSRFTSSASDDHSPAYSPSGTLIVFKRTGAGLFTAGAGETAITSDITDANPDWQPGAPTNSTLPQITGNFSDGGLMFASTGTFASASSYAYQWQRCDSAGANCADISGATSSTYTGTSNDVGKTLRVRVTATSSSGSASATSNQTPVIAGPEPKNVTPPRVIVSGTSGVPMAGVTQFSSVGTWSGTGTLTFAYQWKKCQPKDGPCFRILGSAAQLSSFVPTADLVGWSLRIEITATNSAGSATAESESTPFVIANAPNNIVRPRISVSTTNPTVGQALTVDTGTWSSTAALVYTYQWRRCDPPGTLPSCVPIAGATTNAYTTTQADLGLTLRVYVTATSLGGSGTAISDHTFPTIPAPRLKPALSSAPTLSGEALLGETLTATRGSWTGFAPMRFVATWQRCDATVTVCKAVRKVKGLVYRIGPADLGWRIRLSVVAVNAIGSLRAPSEATEPIVLGPPKPKGRRIVGTNRPEYVPGGGGDDQLFGRGGSDTLIGGAGDDRLDGGAGNDYLDGGKDVDRISGGPGSDTVFAADGKIDRISCGAGNDRVIADPADVVDPDCEAVTRGAAEPPPEDDDEDEDDDGRP
jgi:hypothetical protein